MLKIKNSKYWVFILLIMLGCRQSVFHVDISEVEVPSLQIKRFEQDLFGRGDTVSEEQIDQLYEDYGNFVDLFAFQVIEIGDLREKETYNALNLFLEQERADSVVMLVDSVFADLSQLEQQLTRAFTYYRYYFPENRIPQIYTHISGFNQSLVLNEQVISISLEKYLGDVPIYDRLGVYQYLRPSMHAERIPIDVMKALLFAELDSQPVRLLDQMILQGKVIYFLQCMFPDLPEATLVGYTEEQQQWCERNEGMMWSTLIERKELFSTENRAIRRYIEPAPFTATFPQESPGRTGVWIGYQIVKSYMKHNDVNLVELLESENYEELLQNSHYNALNR